MAVAPESHRISPWSDAFQDGIRADFHYEITGFIVIVNWGIVNSKYHFKSKDVKEMLSEMVEEERNRKKVTSREFIDHDDGEFDDGHDDM